MKVLWLCNIVLPEFSDEFGFKRVDVGGWLTGMWNKLNKHDDIELGICCPIYNKDRMKDGVLENTKYYSFLFFDNSDNMDIQESRFIEILNNFKPDIVHIWGTEYMHTLSMVNACEKCRLLDRTVINIQGLVSVCAKHYTNGLPYDISISSDIQNEIADFKNRGKLERTALQKVRHVIGRTDWDRACTTQINSNVNYHFCNEIIRPSFYKNAGMWDYDKCEKYSVFVSQASYPIKGFHFLLKALPLIIQCCPDVHVYVAGTDIFNLNTIYSGYIRQLIKENSLYKYITFLGMLSENDMCERFKRSNVFVSSSTIENSPNSVCEAMMTGVPVVSSMVGGISSLIKHGESGFLYQHDAPYMLAYYICEIFTNINTAKTISNNAVKAAKAINNSKINSDRCVEIYKKIIGE